MAKKKTPQQQKLLEREHNIKQAKEYWIGLTNFLERLNLRQHLSLLPKSVIDRCITLRISSIRVVPSGINRLKDDEEKLLKCHLENYINRDWQTAYPNGAKFTKKEFIIYLLSFYFTVNNYIEGNPNEPAKTVFKEMIQFTDENIHSLINELQTQVNLTARWESHPFMGYLHFNYFDIQKKQIKGRKPSESWCTPAIFEYNCTEPVRRQLSFDGKKREIAQMAFVTLDCELAWCTVHPSILNKTGETPIPIFIQKHALNRVTERLDIIFDYIQYSVLAQSIAELESAKQIGPNQYLLPTYYNGYKLGYMVTSYVDDILVVTTFLFITQEGTPEGLLLDKLTGFMRLDKSYLCIDKLSTFIQSDIASKPDLVKLLQEANLGHLVDLHQGIGHICDNQKENLNDPSFILEYIQRKKEEQQLSQTEMQEQEQQYDTMDIP